MNESKKIGLHGDSKRGDEQMCTYKDSDQVRKS